MNSRTAVAALMLLGLNACDARDPVADGANAVAGPSEVEVLPPNEAPASAASGSVAAAEGPIPVALHGRWALTPQDCTSTRGDAKGLLVIAADELRFYESLGRPSPGVQTSEDAVHGNFAFAGEGMEWTRNLSLELQDGKLVRTETDPATSYTYVRCG